MRPFDPPHHGILRSRHVLHVVGTTRRPGADDPSADFEAIRTLRRAQLIESGSHLELWFAESRVRE